MKSPDADDRPRRTARRFPSKSRTGRFPSRIANAPLVFPGRGMTGRPARTTELGGGHWWGRGRVSLVQEPAGDEGAGAFIAPQEPLGATSGKGSPFPFCFFVFGWEYNVAEVPAEVRRYRLGATHQQMSPAVSVGLQDLRRHQPLADPDRFSTRPVPIHRLGPSDHIRFNKPVPNGHPDRHAPSISGLALILNYRITH